MEFLGEEADLFGLENFNEMFSPETPEPARGEEAPGSRGFRGNEPRSRGGESTENLELGLWTQAQEPPQVPQVPQAQSADRKSSATITPQCATTATIATVSKDAYHQMLLQASTELDERIASAHAWYAQRIQEIEQMKKSVVSSDSITTTGESTATTGDGITTTVDVTATTKQCLLCCDGNADQCTLAYSVLHPCGHAVCIQCRLNFEKHALDKCPWDRQEISFM